VSGLYSITPRSDGVVLTAAEYNADHQNHVDNNIPASIDDYSQDASQMQTVFDPGEVGSEVLPGSLAEELAALRKMIVEQKGTSQWYETYTTRKTHGSVQFIEATDGTWHATGTTIAFYRLQVPDGWQASSNLTLKIFRRSSSAAGSSRMTSVVFRVRDGAAISNVAASDIDFTPGDTNSHVTSITISGASFAAGDVISVQVSRLGSDGADTNTGSVAPDGHWFEYTGAASR
jgi:hypothetical protein